MRSLRLILLTVFLGLTVWLSGHPDAEAYPGPLCSNVDGSPCYFEEEGATASCWSRVAGTWGTCWCEYGYGGQPNKYWRCHDPGIITE
jgi:hypothetical protein